MPSSACTAAHRHLHSFPTRRSSDLVHEAQRLVAARGAVPADERGVAVEARRGARGDAALDARLGPRARAAGRPRHGHERRLWGQLGDRKSTRLNSSHGYISYAVFCLHRRPPTSTLFPYTTLFRSCPRSAAPCSRPRSRAGRRARRCSRSPPGSPRGRGPGCSSRAASPGRRPAAARARAAALGPVGRSEEHTSELQSRLHLVCRLLLAPPPTDIYTLSLHDALPILSTKRSAL